MIIADNRRKVRNVLSQAPNFSAFIRQTEAADDTTNISAQMKVAILQFLSTGNSILIQESDWHVLLLYSSG